MSSCLNALSAVTWEDFLKPIVGHKVSEVGKTWITKVLVIFYGAAGVGFAFMAQNLGGTVLQASLSFTGAASGPLLGIFLLGSLFPWANWIGCVCGGLLGLALPIWISIGAYSLPKSPSKLDFPTYNCSSDVGNVTMATGTTFMSTVSTASITTVSEISGIDNLYTLSYLWYPSVGTATAVIVGLLVSFITGPTSMDEVDPKYLMPLFDRLFCCLPERLRRKLRCNLDFRDPEDIQHDEKDEEIVYKQNGSVRNSNSSKNPEIDEKYPPTTTKENGITMLSFTPRDKEHAANDNIGYIQDGMNHSEPGWIPPPAYEQLTDL